MDITIYFDGGTDCNRVCVYDPQEHKYMVKQINSAKTNNELEYHALIRALKYARLQYKGADSFTFIGDSRLIIEQVFGNWKINKQELRDLNEEVEIQISYIRAKVNGKWVRRDDNMAGVHLETLKKQE